ncbi:MAG: isoaspartyl peptidase/L-asparaginase [Haloferacaceae archaeon]
MRLVVHGGVGSAPSDPAAREAALDAAATGGTGTATPLDAVERAVRRLEDDDRFNAGIGSALQADGVARTDAGLATDDGRVGAACAMPGVARAVSVARAVLEATPHVLVAGEGAVRLAEAVDVPTGVDLTTERTRERYASADPPADPVPLAWVRERFGGTDTVGAVASDGERYAAATSTGGRWFALPGRVGDVPQSGAGFHCTPAGAASATGDGEVIARFGLARRAVAGLEDGLPADRAAARAVSRFEAATDATAGVIVLGSDGAGSAHNGEAMVVATATQ